MLDNEDLCRMFVINRLRLTVQPDEKLIFHRGVPMVVKKKRWEKLIQKLSETLWGLK